MSTNLIKFPKDDEPPIAMGTGGIYGRDALDSIEKALQCGYTCFDTAYAYNNEKDIGRALSYWTQKREDYRIITKLPGRNQGYSSTLKSIQSQLTALGTDYIDIYLIHWPNPRANLYVESWKAMQKARNDGLIGHIGVSNFTQAMVERLTLETGESPDYCQVESHPWWPQSEYLKWLSDYGTTPMAWSPLRKNQGEILKDPEIAEIASNYGKTIVDTILLWHKARGVIPVVKSKNPQNIKSNIETMTLRPDPRLVAAFETLTRRCPRGPMPDDHEEI